MNKMNIPAPFRMALPTPPLPPPVPTASAPQPPPLPPSVPVQPTPPPTADLSSSESEMDSDEVISREILFLSHISHDTREI